MLSIKELILLALGSATHVLAQGTFRGVPYGEAQVVIWHSNLVRTRVDPVVYPGTISPHVHNVVGGNGFGPNMTYESLRKSTCNTHQVAADMSAWWSPQLYYKDQSTGKLSLLAIETGDGVGRTLYYNQVGKNDTFGLVDYPQGFRMVAGNPFRTHPPTNQAERLITSTCSTPPANTWSYTWMSFPADLDICPDRKFDMAVMFPACWDGFNVDSPDHQSHVAYPENGDGGNCPPGFPYRLPQIGQRFTYQLSSEMPFYPGCIVSAQGDDTGFGYHVDFFNGWEAPPFIPGKPSQESLLVKSLTDPASINAVGGVHGPPNSYASLVGSGCDGPTAGPYLLPSFQGNIRCGYTGLEVDESIGEDGPLDALPGNNPIWSAQNPLQGMPEIKPADFKLAGMPVPDAWQREGCFSGYTAKSSDVLPGNMTPVTCIAHCAKSGYTMSGIENGNTCICGDDLTNSLKYNSTGESMKCTSLCTGAILNSYQFCGGSQVASVYSYTGSGLVTADQPVTPTAEAFSFSTSMPQAPYVTNSVTAKPISWSDSGAMWLTSVEPFTNIGAPTLSPFSSSSVPGASSVSSSTSSVTMRPTATGSPSLVVSTANGSEFSSSANTGANVAASSEGAMPQGTSISATTSETLGGGLVAVATSSTPLTSISSAATQAGLASQASPLSSIASTTTYAAVPVFVAASTTEAAPISSTSSVAAISSRARKTKSKKHKTKTKTTNSTAAAFTLKVA